MSVILAIGAIAILICAWYLCVFLDAIWKERASDTHRDAMVAAARRAYEREVALRAATADLKDRFHRRELEVPGAETRERTGVAQPNGPPQAGVSDDGMTNAWPPNGEAAARLARAQTNAASQLSPESCYRTTGLKANGGDDAA